MRKDQLEQEINFKKRARRRLVGAIALVMLMVIILPMVLKNRALPEYQEEVMITLNNQSSVDIANSSGLGADTKTNKPSVSNKPTEEAAAHSPTLPGDIKEEKTDKIKIKRQPAEKNKVIKETIKPNATGKEAYFVQVGVFSDPVNIKNLQAKLNLLGYQTLTEIAKTSKGNKTRLRTELFDDRNEAAIALENIKDAGLTGMIVRKQ